MPNNPYEQVGQAVRDFADSHPKQFPRKYRFLVGWQKKDGSHNFMNVIRRNPMGDISSVTAQTVDAHKHADRVEAVWNEDGTVNRPETGTWYQDNYPKGYWVKDGRPGIRRARRVFDRLHEEMKPKQ